MEGEGVSMKIAHIVIITNMAMKFNCYTIKYTLTDINFSCRQFSSVFLKHKDHIASFVSCSIIALLNRVKRPCLVIGNNI